MMARETAIHQPRKGAPLAWSDMAMLALAALGFGISAYLTVAHYERFELACVQSAVVDCGAVTHSVYAQLFGTSLPVSGAGLVWFAAMAGLGLLRLRRAGAGQHTGALRTAAALVGVAGIAFVLYLVYVELALVHRICEWCTATHVLALGLFLFSVDGLQADNR